MEQPSVCGILYVVLCCIIYHTSTNAPKTLDYSQEICKYNSFDCQNRGHPMPPKGTASCCQDCVCSEGCVMGNCCPNAIINPNMTAVCTLQTSLFGLHHYLGQLLTTYAYYTIVTCPDDSNVTLKLACDKPEHVHDNNFVSDCKNNNIFKNKYCALCNGVTEFRRWQQGFILGDEVFINDLLKLIEDDKLSDVKKISQIYSLPPVDFPYSMYMCYIYAFDKCNATGNWHNYNETVKYLCEESSLNMAYRSYRNIYCAICNSNYPDELQMTCPLSVDPRKILEVGRYTRLSVLLEPQWYTAMESDALATQHHCAKDEILDPLTENCISLICPLDKYAYFGQCLNNKYSTRGLTVGIILEIQSFPLTNGTIFKHKEVIEQIRAGLGMTNVDCQECFLSIFEYKKGSVNKDILHLAVTTSSKCNESFIINRYERFLHSGHTSFIVQLHGHIFNITLQMLDSSDIDTSVIYPKYFYVRHSRCLNLYNLANKFYCPSVTFNIGSVEFRSLSDYYQEKLTATSVVKLPSNSNSSSASYTACWKRYRKIVAEARLEGIKSSNEMIAVDAVCSGILVSFSILTIFVNSKTPDVPFLIKCITAMVCVAILLGRGLDELFTNLHVLGESSCLILSQSSGCFFTLFVTLIQFGVRIATWEVGSHPNGLKLFLLRLRFVVFLGLFVAALIALSEGMYLHLYTKHYPLSSSSLVYVPHSIACFCPATILLITSIALLIKQSGLKLDISTSASYTLAVSKGLFFVSIFSTLFEIVRTLKNVSVGPIVLILHILCIPYGVLIFIGLTVNLKQFIIDSLVRTWYWIRSTLVK